MYDHLGLKVRDLAASTRFYRAALEPLGHVLGAEDASSASFGSPEGAALYLSRAETTNAAGVHVALRAETRAAVEAFHQAGLGAGGRDHGKPGLRADYGPTYYAAFLLDPDGNNVEAVCMNES